MISCIRLGSLVSFRNSSNLTWDYFDVSLWSTVEIAGGVICACMPSMRLILIRVAPKTFGTTVNTAPSTERSRSKYGFYDSGRGSSKRATGNFAQGPGAGLGSGTTTDGFGSQDELSSAERNKGFMGVIEEPRSSRSAGTARGAETPEDDDMLPIEGVQMVPMPHASSSGPLGRDGRSPPAAATGQATGWYR